MRLGEILIGAGWAQARQVDTALHQQRTDPRRLGALLTAVGGVSVDDVARGLARQRGVPAALERHLAQRDPALATVLPAATALTLAAVPVAWSRGAQGMALVVCFRDPTPEHVAEVQRVTGVPIIPAVACEAVIARELVSAYPGARAGFEDHDAAVDVNFDDPSTPVFALVDLDDRRVLRDESQSRSIPTGNLLPPSASSVARVPPPVPPPRAPAPTIEAAVAAIGAASERDAIAELAVEHLRGAWSGAVIFVVREGLAVGHRGFGGQVSDATVAALVVPLTPPSMFATAIDDRRAVLGATPPSGGLAQSRFLKLFEALGPAPVALQPVAVRERVVNLVFGIGPRAPLPVAAAALTRLAAAMGEAYERLILTGRR